MRDAVLRILSRVTDDDDFRASSRGIHKALVDQGLREPHQKSSIWKFLRHMRSEGLIIRSPEKMDVYGERGSERRMKVYTYRLSEQGKDRLRHGKR